MSNSNGRNYLYRLRRTRGLRQKQLAYLLGYRSAAMVSRLEHGASLPPLKVALLLELVLGARPEHIWADLHLQLRKGLMARVRRLPPRLREHIARRVAGKEGA